MLLQAIIYALLISLSVNFVMFIVAYLKQTDKLTDLSYSLSFILVIWVLLLTETLTLGRIIVALMVTAWGLRLGAYLVIRINRLGHDKRFDEMRKSFVAFGRFWLLQAISVVIILLPAILYLSIEYLGNLHPLSLMGLLIFGAGLVIEATSDLQKYRFIINPKNKGKWINSGFWKYSRHPNYLGEIMVWIGIFLYTAALLDTTGLVVGLISPLYIFILLRFVSGVPLLEKSANDKWGNDPKYKSYKSSSGLILPKFSS